MNLKSIRQLRQDYSLGSEIYLDNASTTKTPRQVIEAMDRYYQQFRASVHRGIYQTAQQATDEYEAARQSVAQLIGADHSSEIIFTSGATTGLNLVAYGLGDSVINPSDTVLISLMEHHANILPWQRLVKTRGARLEYIKVTRDYRLDFNDLAKKLIAHRPKIVSLTQASNVLGTINPIDQVKQLIDRHHPPSVLVVDAAQSLPHLKVGVKKLGADFLVFSSHKLYGPTGVGVVWGKLDWLKKLPPLLVGSQMVKRVDRQTSVFQEPPMKFEAGTPNIAGVIGLKAAIDYRQSYGDQVFDHERQLTAHALNRLNEIPGLKLLGPNKTKDRLGIFAFTLPGIHPHDLAAFLDKSGLAIRAGHHCALPLHRHFKLTATARISMAIYNTQPEIDLAIAKIIEAQKYFSR